MDTIGNTELWSFIDGDERARICSNEEVRRGEGHKVSSFLELAKKISELQFRNGGNVLLFRGQSRDHLTPEQNSTLKPQIFRRQAGQLPSGELIERRFFHLRLAEDRLVERYVSSRLLSPERISRHRILRWSLLQHYEVCPTPLLDVTQSLRIAASFASLDALDCAYLYVLGVPNISGAITANTESGLQIIRLSSVCPPAAVRPHIQEGYLLGEYPELVDWEQKQQYAHFEVDFGRRLVAKFVFRPDDFWNADSLFPQIVKPALYPNASDPLFELCESIRSQFPPELL